MFSNELVCDILNFLRQNLNKEITIDELANIFHFNKTYIMKRFKKEISITIFDYLNSLRIFNSLSMYNYDNYVSYIAYNNGFNSLEYYSEMFKKIMGVSPIIYRKYLSRDISINKNEIDLILNNINKLDQLNNRVDRYLKMRKPKEKMVKSLVFK